MSYCYVIEEFKQLLELYLKNNNLLNQSFEISFEKKTSYKPFGDFSSFVKCNLEKIEENPTLIKIYYKIKDLETFTKEENWPLHVERVNLDENRIIINLNRSQAYLKGLEHVKIMNSNYGNNTNFENKVFLLDDPQKNNICLNDLRAEFLTRLIQALIEAGKGSVLYSKEDNHENLQLLKIGNKCFGDNAVTVGRVKITDGDKILDNLFISAEDYIKYI
uniref:Uncharacterized protein n=1 Tax=Clastoptera arizonana TaxID=38151 RepID=A0A1B6CQ57_9HEMI